MGKHINLTIPGVGKITRESDLQLLDENGNEMEFEQLNETQIEEQIEDDEEQNEKKVQGEPQLEVAFIELLRLKNALRHHRKMINAQNTMIYKEMMKDVCELYEVEQDKLLWLATFGEKGFRVV
jgi:hypothetical protein